MQQTKAFLSRLNDCELSFLYIYKYKTYLPESQKLIDEELTKRRVDALAMEGYKLKYQFNPENVGCPRCNSQRLLTATECSVCGYDMRLEKERKKSKAGKVLDVLGDLLSVVFSH